MSAVARPTGNTLAMPRTILSAVAGLVIGVLAGILITLGVIGLLPFVVGGTLNCSVNSDGSVTACTNDSGQAVKVPHHIRIRP
jgi:hypothetical protein